jgi:hypothetical protein
MKKPSKPLPTPPPLPRANSHETPRQKVQISAAAKKFSPQGTKYAPLKKGR